MIAPTLTQLNVHVDAGVASVTIAAPPLNHFGIQLAHDLVALCTWLQDRDDVRVVVFASAIDGYFIPHLDLNDLDKLPRLPAPVRALGLATMWCMAHAGPPGRWLNTRVLHRLSPFHRALAAVSRLPQITIALVEGRIGGIGSEFAMCLDMRFAARDRAILNQLEAATGLFPGAGGTQRLPLLVGAGRAHEIIASSDDIDAESAERWGYYNRALPGQQARIYVDALARRIARFPLEGPRQGKRFVGRASTVCDKGLQLEAIGFMRALFTRPVRARIAAFLEQGGQRPDGASRLGELLQSLPPPS